MDRTLACEAGNLGSTPNEDTTLSVVIGTLSVPQHKNHPDLTWMIFCFLDLTNMSKNVINLAEESKMKKSRFRKVVIFVFLTAFTVWDVVRGRAGFVTGLTALFAFVFGVILWAEHRDRKKKFWN